MSLMEYVSHGIILFKFFIFNLLLIGADIYTDIQTARYYFLQNHPYWGFYTTLFIFLPFLGKFAIFMFQLFLCFFSKDKDNWYKWKYEKRTQKLKDLLQKSPSELMWNFPPFMIIRNIQLLIGLSLMNTGLPKSHKDIMKIHREALGYTLLEAFLESVPQFTLQCSIIMRTGNTNFNQCICILVSFLSITFASIKLFYSQRLGRYSDLDPSLKMTVFVAIPIVILIAGPLAAVVCMAAYFQEKVIVYIMVILVFNAFVLKSPCLKDLLGFSHNCKYVQNEQTPEEEARQDSETIFFTALFTSWISPCTVWCSNFYCKSKFLLVSSLTNLLTHCMGIASIFIFILSAELPMNDNPPITHCFMNVNNISLSDSEMPSDLFVKVGGFVMLMLIISFIAAVYLYHMGNYSNMFKLSSIFGVPIMHPTLLQDIVGAGFRGKDTKL